MKKVFEGLEEAMKKHTHTISLAFSYSHSYLLISYWGVKMMLKAYWKPLKDALTHSHTSTIPLTFLVIYIYSFEF